MIFNRLIKDVAGEEKIDRKKRKKECFYLNLFE